MLLRILSDYDDSFRVLAAEVIELLLACDTFAHDVTLHDGIALFISLLHADNEPLAPPLLRSILALIANAPTRAQQLRILGGVNVVVSVLASSTGGGAVSQASGPCGAAAAWPRVR